MSERIDCQSAMRTEPPWECPGCKTAICGLDQCVCDPAFMEQVRRKRNVEQKYILSKIIAS